MPDGEENIFSKCFGLMNQGASRDTVLSFLRAENLPADEAFLVIMKLYGLRTEQARRCLVTHPSWQAEVAGLVSPWPGSFVEWLKSPVADAEQPTV